MFDWIEFLQQHGIPYVTSGPNVAQGNVNIKCPWCGASDPSEHLGINLDNGYWGCWRSSDHRGRKPEKLIQALIGCSFNTARSIVGRPVFNTSKLDSIIAVLKDEKTPRKYKSELELPDSFHSIYQNRGFLSARKIFEYLYKQRGFEKTDVEKVCGEYTLLYSLDSKWKDRIIFPIYMETKLVGWTGRSISKTEDLRYLTLSHKDKGKGEPVAPCNIKDTLWNYDDIRTGGKVLYLVEGPFDALKLDFYSKKYNIRSTCLFNNQISDAQAVLIAGLSEKFKEIRILFDSETLSQAMKMNNKMSGIVDRVDNLPKAIKDPGDFSKQQIIEFLIQKSLLS